MRRIILATAAGILSMSSLALAQTSSTPGTAPSSSATTTGQGTSSGGGRDIADPTRKGVEQSPGGTRGTEAPGSQTTGGGMQPSDRSMGSKSGGN
jgi:hypothetical protein